MRNYDRAPMRHSTGYCLHCGEYLDPEWARSNQIFCDRRCENAEYYRRKGKPIHQNRYLAVKKEWSKSDVGRRAGLSIHRFMELPRSFR